MKLLVDNALSPLVARLLRERGHDAVHIRERMPADSPDETVFERAASEGRIIVSADTDFGVLLASRGLSQPSLILLRHDAPGAPEAQASLLLRILAASAADLERGCVISVTRNRARLRMLPLA